MVGDSISKGSLFGNLVALAIPINFAILVMIIRKNTKILIWCQRFFILEFLVVYTE